MLANQVFTRIRTDNDVLFRRHRASSSSLTLASRGEGTMAATSMASGVLSLVPISEGLAVKEDFSLESAVVTLRKLDARDKFTKIMQYGARFFYWWFKTTDPSLSESAYKLYRTTQRSRKAFRMLKILDELVKLRQILRDAQKNENDPSGRGGFLGYTEALLSFRCLAMGCFWTFDNLNYLTVTDTINFGVARAQTGFSRSWSVGSALSILIGIESLRKTEKKRRELALEYATAVDHRAPVRDEGFAGEQCVGEGERQEVRLREALARANAEHFKSWLVAFKGVLDLTCAVNISGIDLPERFLGHKLNDGIVGAAGCASALCVLYNSWPARQQRKSLVPQASPVNTAVTANGSGT